MSHTNSTTNFGLPQFITTDKPAWLTDVNVAYAAIDTAMKNNQTAASNAQGDATQALTDAGTALTTASAADSKASGAGASIAASFLDSATYAVGDLIMYNNLLYRCHTAVSTPGAWTGNTNWSRTDMDQLISGMNGNTLAMPSAPYTSGSVAAEIGDLKSDKADKSTTYTKTEVNSLLSDKLDSAVHVTSGNGNFPGLVAPNEVWLVAVMRMSIENSCVLLVHNHNGTMHVKEIVRDQGMSYITNSQGTITITYGGSGENIRGGAYQLV